jgi:hypothetical protein
MGQKPLAENRKMDKKHTNFFRGLRPPTPQVERAHPAPNNPLA